MIFEDEEYIKWVKEKAFFVEETIFAKVQKFARNTAHSEGCK